MAETSFGTCPRCGKHMVKELPLEPWGCPDCGYIQTQPSPVRASAQEQRKVATEAKTLWLAIARAEQEVFEDELTYVSVAPFIIAALTAAEARQMDVDEERCRVWQEEVAALTQALKEIADEKLCEDEPDKCYQDSGPYCGKHIFDDHLVKIARAALTGAQAKV